MRCAMCDGSAVCAACDGYGCCPDCRSEAGDGPECEVCLGDGVCVECVDADDGQVGA